MRALILIAVLSLTASCTTQKDKPAMDKLDERLQSLVDKHKTPSVSYLLFNKDSLIHSFQSGYADISKEEYVTENTRYYGFSVTKTFTALAILQLAEEGKLSIDDRVEKHLNDFPYPAEISIRHLLTHTTGLPNPLPLRWVHSPEENPTFDRDAFFEQVCQQNAKVKSAPNEKFNYSNLGYYFLGRIIETIAGQLYEDYIEEHILKRLDIENETLGFQVNHENPHAVGYQKRFSFMNFLLGFLMDKKRFVNQREGKWISFNDMLLNGPSHGGLIGTPTSFMRYVQDLLKPDGVLLSATYKSMLFTENQTNSKQATGMCLSWFKGQLKGNTYYSHAGGGAGYYCEIRIYPELGIGSVVMFNRTGMSDERALNEFDAFYLNQ